MALTEQEIVPYAAVALRGEKLLVLAPHPDDEVIACGGLIALHALEKRQVRVLIASDGTAAEGEQATSEDYRIRRERESTSGLAELGGPTPHFLRLPDRGLAESHQVLREALKRELMDFSPDLVAVPSPIEVHPDHLALTRALVELIQNDEELVGELAVCKVAFYEVSQPIQPNALVDITDCAELKYRALSHHSSQQEIRDYEWFARGLNQYRSMTLSPSSRYAEAYFVLEVPKLRTEPWSNLARYVGGLAQAVVIADPVPMSVIIRTRNRHSWLKDAVNSIRANRYPASVVVVNDGGSSPKELFADENLTVIDQSHPVGRSEAMNVGVRASQTPFIAFLDDDDLYYPEHLSTLATAIGASSQVAYYTDAVSTFHSPAEDGSFRETARLRLFAQDFDRDLLLFDNYIPLPTLAVRREEFLDVGGFNKAFDLLEDWDFLIRLSGRGPFLRIPRLTCEIRHFLGGDSAILASPEDSSRFREAKLKIWKSYRSQMTPEVMANVFESQKRRLASLYSEAVEKKGLARHLERDVTRLDREKTLLLEQLQKAHADRSDTEARLRGEIEALRANARELEKALREGREAFDQAVKELNAHIQRLNSSITERDVAIAAKDRAIVEKDQMTRALFAEIKRLNDLLNLIYRSRTWKLHRFIERITGRGE